MKKALSFMPIALALLVSGCTIEEEKSTFICTTAENSKIDGEAGFRDVFLVESYNNLLVGYSQGGRMVNHSECSASSVKFDVKDSSNTYEWFYFGTRKANDEGLLAIKFYNYNGKEISEAERDENQGIPTHEVVEQDIGGGSALITKRVWKKEPFLDSVVFIDRYKGVETRYASATSGKLLKKKEFDFNSKSWNCSYNEDGSIFHDFNCENEEALDVQFFGFSVNLDSYIKYGNSVSFETDEDELIKDIDKYYR